MQKLKTLSTAPETEWVRAQHTNSKRYRKFRNAIHAKRCLGSAARNESVCVDCACEGEPYGPLDVHGHHLQPTSLAPHLVYDADNLEFLCRSHHGYRNQHERAAPHIGHRHVVYGMPGTGKTTLVAEHAGDRADVWDADVVAERLGYGDYHARDTMQVAELTRRRDSWMMAACRGNRETWAIVRWPKTAWMLAARLKAAHVFRCVRIDGAFKVIRCSGSGQNDGAIKVMNSR